MTPLTNKLRKVIQYLLLTRSFSSMVLKFRFGWFVNIKGSATNVSRYQKFDSTRSRRNCSCFRDGKKFKRTQTSTVEPVEREGDSKDDLVTIIYMKC